MNSGDFVQNVKVLNAIERYTFEISFTINFNTKFILYPLLI